MWTTLMMMTVCASFSSPPQSPGPLGAVATAPCCRPTSPADSEAAISAAPDSEDPPAPDSEDPPVPDSEDPPATDQPPPPPPKREPPEPIFPPVTPPNRWIFGGCTDGRGPTAQLPGICGAAKASVRAFVIGRFVAAVGGI